MNSGESSPIILSRSVFAFPKLGIPLKYLDVLIFLCGGRKVLDQLTTYDVCERFIKPFTKEKGCSYCQLLSEKYGDKVAKKANVFISHAWKYPFLNVVDAIRHHFDHYRPSHLENEEIIVWIDLLSNNQHIVMDLDFELWCETFKSAIKEFHYTVLVLSPWKDPIPLTRAWCLFEIFCTAESDSHFEIAMIEEEKNSFFTESAISFLGSTLRTRLSAITGQPA